MGVEARFLEQRMSLRRVDYVEYRFTAGTIASPLSRNRCRSLVPLDESIVWCTGVAVTPELKEQDEAQV